MARPIALAVLRLTTSWDFVGYCTGRAAVLVPRLAPALKVKLVALGVHDANEIGQVLTAFAAEGNGGLVVTPHAVTLTNRDLIVGSIAHQTASNDKFTPWID